jgi:hypothetical protein
LGFRLTAGWSLAGGVADLDASSVTIGAPPQRKSASNVGYVAVGRLELRKRHPPTQGLLEPLAEALLDVMPTMNVALHMTYWM